jgi:DNA polymerase-3 subunit beta
VDVSLSAKHVRFSWAGGSVLSRLLDGTFPEYTQCIPRDAKAAVTIDPKTWIAGLSKLRVDDKENMLKLESDPAGVKVTGKDSEVSLPCTGSWPFPIGFNRAYVLDALRQCKGSVRVELAEWSMAGMFLDQGSSFWALIMPLQLPDQHT